MKLWHVAQWGNRRDFDLGKGDNGYDTQCIVAAPTLAQAVEKAEHHLANVYQPIKGGRTDVACLLGDDGRPDSEPEMVINMWVAVAANLRHYPAWYRSNDTGEWLTQLEMFGV